MHGSFHAPFHCHHPGHKRARRPAVCYRGRAPRLGSARQWHGHRPARLPPRSQKMVKKIEVHDLRLSYGPKEVIHGISFDVWSNEILGVIGPAQSAKTSLLRCINRTIEFTEKAKVHGTIKIDGVDVQKVPSVYELRRKIGMVAPLPVGLPLSIYDNVAFAPRSAGMTSKSELDP